MIDFVDLGSGEGGSIEWSQNKFGGKSHLGINNRLKECEIANSKGYNVIFGDIVNDDFPNARYFTMLHVLEHLKTEEDVEKVIIKSVNAAQEFVFIKGPYFDCIDYLKSYDFKLTWTDWIGHSVAITTDLLKSILHKHNLKYEIGYLHPVIDSRSSEIIPITSPVDIIIYNENLGEKKYVTFQNVYREIYCFININCANWENIIKTNL